MIFVSFFFLVCFTVAQSQSTLPHLTLRDVFLISDTFWFKIYLPIYQANNTCGWSSYCFFCQNPPSSLKDLFIALNNETFPTLYNNIATNACSSPSSPLFATLGDISNTILVYWCKSPYATCDPIQPNPNVLSTYASCILGDAIRANPYNNASTTPCEVAWGPLVIRFVSYAGFDPSFVSKLNLTANSVCQANGNKTYAVNEFDVAAKTVCTDPTITCDPICPLTPRKN